MLPNRLLCAAVVVVEPSERVLTSQPEEEQTQEAEEAEEAVETNRANRENNIRRMAITFVSLGKINVKFGHRMNNCIV